MKKILLIIKKDSQLHQLKAKTSENQQQVFRRAKMRKVPRVLLQGSQ
jgi:predicted sulfurtransferase